MDSGKKIYMLGIGGISMYAIALFLKKMGMGVRGYDAKASLNTTLLEKNGVIVDYKIRPELIDEYTVIIYTGAIKKDNAILKMANEKNITIYTRAQALAYIAHKHNHIIAVAGSHGKSTTTALLGEIFLQANKKPSLHIGAFSKNLEESFIVGDGDYFITEACEYENSFLMLKPDVSIVTNIDRDHLDYFKTFDNLKESFKKFMLQSKIVVVNSDCELKLKNNITYGFKNSTFLLKKCKKLKNFRQKLKIYKNNKFFGTFVLGVPYFHNAINALGAIAVADHFHINKETIGKAMLSFSGVKRRFERIGKTSKNAEVFVDYAHHPKEISETLKGTRKITKRKIVVVFQPHTYSRTKLLMEEFLASFDYADDLIIFETFSAREKYVLEGSAKTLSNLLGKKRKCKYFSSRKQLVDYILNNTNKKCLILFMGAGDINRIADLIVTEKS